MASTIGSWPMASSMAAVFLTSLKARIRMNRHHHCTHIAIRIISIINDYKGSFPWHGLWFVSRVSRCLELDLFRHHAHSTCLCVPIQLSLLCSRSQLFTMLKAKVGA